MDQVLIRVVFLERIFELFHGHDMQDVRKLFLPLGVPIRGQPVFDLEHVQTPSDGAGDLSDRLIVCPGIPFGRTTWTWTRTLGLLLATTRQETDALQQVHFGSQPIFQGQCQSIMGPTIDILLIQPVDRIPQHQNHFDPRDRTQDRIRGLGRIKYQPRTDI